jgi:HEPN superfamily RiboL-PSP-like protein
MVRGSNRFVELRHRLEELTANLLGFLPPPPQSRTSYTSKEFDLARSYIVLAHAEIESYCESLAKEKAGKAVREFDSGAKVTPVLRRIVAYFVAKNLKSWGEVRVPSPEIVQRAYQSYLETVRSNNGVKRSNLERLLFPLGLSESDLDITWLAQMDSFGSTRGEHAHNSTRVVNPPDPATVTKTVGQLLQGLLALDRTFSRLH